MALTLKDSYGRVIAKTEDTKQAVDTKITKTIGNKTHKLLTVEHAPENSSSEETQIDTGYVDEDEIEVLTESTVQIPQNFAGMESVMVPTRLVNQLFDITEVNEQDGYVEIVAVHMFYRQRQNSTLFDPSLTTKYSGASCCRNVLTNAMFDQGFKVASDSTDLILGNQLDFARKNIVEAFLDPESGICARYGLSIIRNNDVFFCLKNVGYDRGFVIQDKKNMLGVERTESVEDTITRVAPVGRDEDGEIVWLNNNGLKYVDSTHIGDYVSPKLEIYQTDIRIGEDDVTAANINAKLLAAAQKRFTDDEVDIPEVTMNIQFVSLGDTEEYAQYRNLDKVYLYDIIHIKDTERGYSYSAQVIGVQHNVLTGMLESVTIGTPKKWDGVRKIGSWQVPDFNGGKIREGSIRAGSFEKDAVRTDDIAPAAVTADHMSTSADNHFKTIFAEELYISNTSEDGLLNTRFSVSEGEISTLITKTGINSLGEQETLYSSITQTADSISLLVDSSTGEVTPASIILAINQNLSTIRISADQVYINGTVSIEKLLSGQSTITDLSVTNLTVSNTAATWQTETITTYTLSPSETFTKDGGGTATGCLVTGSSSTTIHYLGSANT